MTFLAFCLTRMFSTLCSRKLRLLNRKFHGHLCMIYSLLYVDILYLNKQRLQAVEELNRTNREKQLLLDKIAQLKVERQSSSGKGDGCNMCCTWRSDWLWLVLWFVVYLICRVVYMLLVSFFMYRESSIVHTTV